MRLKPVVVDVIVAAVIAVIVLIVSPGVAVTGILAMLFLIVCGVTLLFDSRRTRRARAPRRVRAVRRR
jgi:hypothetical protein